MDRKHIMCTQYEPFETDPIENVRNDTFKKNVYSSFSLQKIYENRAYNGKIKYGEMSNGFVFYYEKKRKLTF